MDIVLELTDTLIADYAYAYLYPIRPELYDFSYEAATNISAQAFSSWTWKPATKFLQVQPSQAAYMSSLTRDNPYRQLATLIFITWFIKNQIWLEIKQANKSMPFMAVCTAPLFLLEVRGYGNLYDTTDEGPGIWYNILQFPIFLLFTDLCIYWIHRCLHHPLFYKHLHKPHHKWIMPTPYASHAFHPLDGFAQSLPYHIFPFIFPLQKVAYVILFVFVNFWSILIHDGEYLTNNSVVNGAACHSLHHSRFEVNYGQFFTVFDRLGGTYRMPEAWMFEKEKKMSEKQWEKEAKTVDGFVKEIEGDDERAYGQERRETKKIK
ncbi:hypothetical protein EsHS_00004210 [Epichloe bromicola]